jgi:hypothetical protein
MARIIFMDFEILEAKSAIIFLNRINRLIFVMEGECDLCEVGTQSLNVIQIIFILQMFK